MEEKLINFSSATPPLRFRDLGYCTFVSNNNGKHKKSRHKIVEAAWRDGRYSSSSFHFLPLVPLPLFR